MRYGPHHVSHDEWVYNGADIDGAKVVWARDMDTRGNRELLDFQSDTMDNAGKANLTWTRSLDGVSDTEIRFAKQP